MKILQIENLSMEFRSVFGRLPTYRALEDISFTVESGSVTAILGPNGAGKTTLFKVISSLLLPSAGDIRFEGNASLHTNTDVGFVSSDDRSLYWRLTGWENLRFFGALFGVSRRVVQERGMLWGTTLGLQDQLRRPVSAYSTGMRKKLSLIRALLPDPNFLLLDELTSGLDIQSCRLVINKLKSEFLTTSRCILWSTHRLEELDKIDCDQVVVLDGGKIAFCGAYNTNSFDYQSILCESA